MIDSKMSKESVYKLFDKPQRIEDIILYNSLDLYK